MTDDIDIAAWQPAAFARDLPPTTVIPARCGPHEVALWRGASGHLRAWADRCPHRGMRLSHGFVRGDMLSCIYHGWRYDGEGRCRKIPAHPGLAPPASITIPRFSVVETDGVVWIAAEPVDVTPPALPAGLEPLRSIEIACGAAAARRASGTIAGEIHVLVQPTGTGSCMLHALIHDGDAKRASRRLEALRRTLETEAA